MNFPFMIKCVIVTRTLRIILSVLYNFTYLCEYNSFEILNRRKRLIKYCLSCIVYTDNIILNASIISL